MVTNELVLGYRQAKKVFDSPALIRRANGYPTEWQGKVPLLVRLTKGVKSDIPLSTIPFADDGDVYPVWVNSFGAVAIIYKDGNTLGVMPKEFEVILWHE